MIRIQNLCHDYPGVRALQDVSVRLEPRTITALVGPNGAGKTTLMRCLCGLERPLSGEIEVDGINVIDEPRRSHERIGYLADFFGVYDNLSVAQCLEYAAAANGIRNGLTARVLETATALGLADRLQQAAGTLSRGLRQRLAIAQAIIHSPRLLVLDEPAAGLDPAARHSLALLLRHLQASGMTLLVSSHILAELEEYATHMLIIDGGRIRDFRALAPLAQSTRALVLELAGVPTPDAIGFLGAQAGVAKLRQTGSWLAFEFTGDPHAQAALLKTLIMAGWAVSALHAERADLQQLYLDTLNTPDARHES
jgi:ABC-2 type transport system ATP-binding protein